MTVVAEKGSSSSFRSLNSFFAKALLIVFTIFCLNFLFTNFSVAQLALGGGPPGDRALESPSRAGAFSSWFDASSFPTLSLLGGIVSSARKPALGSVSRQTTLRLFSLPDEVLNTELVLGAYRNLCYNGSHILTLGPSVACEVEEPGQVGDGGVPDTPLHRISCDNAPRLEFLQAKLHREFWVPVDSREEEWFFRRRASVTWEPGTTSFIHLDRTTANCAHFLSKANFILLMNGATTPAGLRGVVDRFYFLLHQLREKQWLDNPGNQRGFLATYLAGALNRVLSLFNVAELQSSDVLGNHSIVAAQGRVRIGGHPFMGASEGSPLCFEQALLPGILKSSFYPPGRRVPDVMRHHFREWLHLEANETDRPVLLYIRRDGLRRVFLRESEDRLAPVLRNLEGFSLHNISFSGMSFREQFRVSQEASVVISLHGANLVNPSMLSRRSAILIELQPYRVLHRMYETRSFHIGVIYMGHQLDQGTPQENDYLFPGLVYWPCMAKPECKEYFVHHRNVELTAGDLRQIQQLLTIARRLHFELLRNGVTPDASQDLFEPGLLRILKEETRAEISCGPFLAKKNDTCRNTWLSYADRQGQPRICYVAQDCQLAD